MTAVNELSRHEGPKPRLKCDGNIPGHWIEFGDGERFWLRTEFLLRWDCPCGEWNVLPGSDWARESFEDHFFDLCPRNHEATS